MPTRRHHIHLICNLNDTGIHALVDALTIFFEPLAQLTYDLFTTNNESANYSWRCINTCDFVLVLIGNDYGKLTNTGVSQLHISYLNAKTKLKPMGVFAIHSVDRSRQLTDLIGAMSSQSVMVHYVNNTTNLKSLFNTVYGRLIDDLNTQHTDTPSPKTEKPAPLPTTTVKELPTKTAHYDHNLQGQVKTTLNLQDELLLSCTAHAFQGGTLIEVSFMATTTWQAILESLVDTAMAFSLQGLWRLLNDEIFPQAMPAVKISYPDVHAISRCQVTKADVVWVQQELTSAGWIAKLPNTTGKETWRVTELARLALG